MPTISFQATLETWSEGMDYCAVAVPPEVTDSLGTKKAVLVQAQVNDSAPFQVSLFPVGGGQHYLRVKAKVRRETGVQVGDRIQVQFTVLDRAQVAVPADLHDALAAAGALQAFDALPPGKRSYAIRRIGDAARPDTRARRVQETVQMAQPG